MYLPIYIKTDYSLLDSMIKIDDLIEKAKKLNYKVLNITDNNMSGVMEFYRKCTINDIKPIIGLEVTLNKKFILYAKNNRGYKNLIKITSNEINIDLLKQYSSDLICIIPFGSRELYNDFNLIFDDIFIGYKNKEEFNLIKEKSIYLNEIVSLNREDTKYVSYLYAIKNNELLSNIEIDSKDNYLKEETFYLSNDLTLQNNKYIIDNCNVTLEEKGNFLPSYDCGNMDSFSYLKQLCLKGMKERFGNQTSKTYQDRLKYELGIINKMGFCNYFLIVQDYINYAKKNNILVGPGRGSVAGSLVAYVLNITEVDPIKYDLLFERFLNPERITMPDIDIDFEFNRRDEVINYCINKYGVKKVVGIITFGTMGAKQVLRDIGRVSNVDISKIDLLARAIDSNLNLKDNLNKNKKLSYLLEDKELLDVYKASYTLEGLKRHTSTHAAGVVMSSIEIDNIVPLVKKNDSYVTGYSMDYLEDLGLLKMDFLALKTLTTITDIINLINKKNMVIDFNNMPLDDEKTFKLFETGNTLGIFQFESNGIINFIKKFKPSNLEDLFAVIALYRPGPMDNIDSYIKRKEGKEKIDFIIPDLEPILSPTYGIIVYQEQIMQIASLIASYSLGEADILRRAISKKKESSLLKEQDKFIERAIKNNYNKEDAVKVFDLILKFASYGFNRAHSVGYALISYKMAYLKSNYLVQFITCLLNSSVSSLEDIKNYINDAKLNNVDILKPSINKSNSIYTIEDNGVRLPLSIIKNINAVVIDNILKNKGKTYTDIFDFIWKVDKKIINKNILKTLILSGCFEEFNINKKTLIDNIDLIINYGELSKSMSDSYSLKPILEEKEEYDNSELSIFELDSFGFYLSNHPVSNYKCKYQNIVDSKDIEMYFDKIIDIIVYVDRKNEIETKKKDKMCFINGSDEYGSLELVIFPDNYKNLLFEKSDILLVRGKVEKRFDKYQIIVSNLKKLI